MSTLPNCYRCGCQPCECPDGIALYCADCRDVLGLLPSLTVDSIGVMVTDPPYGIGYKSGAMRDGKLSRGIVGDDTTELRDFALQWHAGRPAVVFGSWRSPAPVDARQMLVWDTKGALGMGALDLPWKPSWQGIFILGKGFHGPRTSGVLRFAPVQSMAKNGRLHPHEKPVPLLCELLNKSPSGLIIDPFTGSGTTLRAAKDLGRKAIGIEIEEKYCKIAANRLRQEVLF